MLLVSGLVSAPKPLSQIQRSTRWLLQGLSPRTSFGGFGFSLINGPAEELNLSFVASLPTEFCHGVFPDHPLCPSREALPGGDYGEQLNGLLRRFEPRFASAAGVFVFPLSLSQEEVMSLTQQMAPRMEALVDEMMAELAKLTPPTQFLDDHNQLVAHFERIGTLVDEIVGAASEGDLIPARQVGPAAARIFCETDKSLTSEEFKAIVAVHIDAGPPGQQDCE